MTRQHICVNLFWLVVVDYEVSVKAYATNCLGHKWRHELTLEYPT